MLYVLFLLYYILIPSLHFGSNQFHHLMSAESSSLDKMTNIGEAVSITDYAEREWRGDTPKARTIKQVMSLQSGWLPVAGSKFLSKIVFLQPPHSTMWQFSR